MGGGTLLYLRPRAIESLSRLYGFQGLGGERNSTPSRRREPLLVPTSPEPDAALGALVWRCFGLRMRGLRIPALVWRCCGRLPALGPLFEPRCFDPVRVGAAKVPGARGRFLVGRLLWLGGTR